MNKILATISICMFLYLCLKNDGIIDYYKVSQHHQTLLNKQNILVDELEQIKSENKLLKHNKRYIEKIVREEYFYIYPDEIIISID
tara:strand:+ start:250 stop:507 length:258 start_codon:yes stop_codon:yes gene_type:complete